MKLVLASGSPRRSLLLTAAGFTIDVRPPDVDESLLADESATESVLRIAELKANSTDRTTDEVVLAADTMVVLDGKPLGKPADTKDASRMLASLSGRTHSVLTGWIAVGDLGERFDVTETRVSFKTLTANQIASYINDAQPFDKAGAYGIQGEDGRLIENVVGSRANVMGLPLREVVDALNDLGVERSTPHR
jgi:septum formation protein